MAYTTTALVIEWLGTNYDSTNDLTTADVTAFIAQSDGEVDEAASRNFYKFNAVDSSASDGTDTYVTPFTVQLASRHRAVAHCMNQIRAKTGNPAYNEKLEEHNAQALYYMALLSDPTYRGDVFTYRDETITFGTLANSWDLNTHEAFIGAGTILDSGDPPHIIKNSVAISANSTVTSPLTQAQAARMRHGCEFYVDWVPSRRNWVFTAQDSTITSLITTLKVTYNWTYERDLARDPAISGVLLSG